jgi:putative ABC transport system substrate-binding protein
MENHQLPRLYLTASIFIFLITMAPCFAADVVIVADEQLKSGAEILNGIRQTLGTASSMTISPVEAKKRRLVDIVHQQHARLVITLGRDALIEAAHLPATIPVVYGMIVIPPHSKRPNTTGVYLAVPASRYLDLVNNHLHQSIYQVAVVGSHDHLAVLAPGPTPRTVHTFSVTNTPEIVRTLRHVENGYALLLLPDASLLTSVAMEEAYVRSSQRRFPLLGTSESQVREGALLALVADLTQVGNQIGECAVKALKGMNLNRIQPAPPRKLNLYLNVATAKRLKIHIPDELLMMAKRVY